MLKSTHLCNLNYTGPSTGMEVTGAKSIFERSIEKYHLAILNFVVVEIVRHSHQLNEYMVIH